MIAVAFAYVTNKLFVFDSKSWKASVVLREAVAFVGARVFTGLLEIAVPTLLFKIGLDQAAFGIEGFAAKAVTSVALLNEDLDAEKAAIEGDLADGKHYRVTTSVASDVAETVITIDGRDYSAKRNGLRFVVYDNDLHCVVESAAIVTNNEGYKIVHSSAFIQDLRRHLLEYEKVALKDL